MLVPDGTRAVPVAAARPGGAPGPARAGVPAHGAGRARDARPDERGRACRAPGVHRAEPVRGPIRGPTVRNHEWWKPETFAHLGTIPAARIEELSEGRLSLEVEVLLNRAVVDHDIALVVGPVLPHEVVGHVRRQQVLLPRGRRAADHRRVALARRAHHLGRDHRNDGVTSRPDRRGRADPGREVRVLRGDGGGGSSAEGDEDYGAAGEGRRRVRMSSRAGCTRSRSATASRRGPTPRRSARRRT